MIAVWIVAAALILFGTAVSVWGAWASRGYDGGTFWGDPRLETRHGRALAWAENHRGFLAVALGAVVAGAGGVTALFTAPPWA